MRASSKTLKGLLSWILKPIRNFQANGINKLYPIKNPIIINKRNNEAKLLRLRLSNKNKPGTI